VIFDRAELLGAGLIGALFLLILLAAECWTRLGSPKAEWTRKAVHLGGGLVCLLFPFLIESWQIVLVIACLMVGLFVVGASTGLLKCVHQVERRTLGSVWYPLAIFLVFLLAHDRPWLYVCAVLTLAVADAAAALVGGPYGSIRFVVGEGRKSLEGSAAFLVIAFLVMWLPMVFMTELSPATCALSALLVAVLVTGFEIISLGGTDNLFVPVAVCEILARITTKPLGEIAFRNVSLLGVCGAVALVAWQTQSFNVGAAIVVILFAFAGWSLGSLSWALPVGFGFVLYVASRLWAARRGGQPGINRVRTTARALLVPLGILIVANVANAHAICYGPFIAAGAALLTFIVWHSVVRVLQVSDWRRYAAAALTGLAAWGVAVVPVWFLQGGVSQSALIAVAVTTALAGIANDLLMDRQDDAVSDHPWTAEKFLLVCAAAALIAMLQYTDVVELWNPMG